MKRLIIATFFIFSVLLFGGITAYAAEPNTTDLPYVIADGITYYESSWGFGSGQHAVVNSDNPYTTKPCFAGINGYSYLDENGDILAHNYDESTNDITIPEAPEGAVKLFKHFRSTSFRNGWVDSDNVSLRETPSTPDDEADSAKPSEQTPEEIINDIDEDTKTKKTAIVVDYSGTMSDKQQQVVSLLETLEFNDNTTIIVFGSTFQIVSREDLKNKNFSVGEDTHMFQALNKAVDLGVEQIILISDLDTFGDTELKASDKLKSVTIYNPLYDGLFVSYGATERTGEYSGGKGGQGTDRLWSEYFVNERLQPVWEGVKIEQVKIK